MHPHLDGQPQAPLTLVDALAIALDWIQRAEDELTCQERARRHEQVESDARRAAMQSPFRGESA